MCGVLGRVLEAYSKYTNARARRAGEKRSTDHARAGDVFLGVLDVVDLGLPVDRAVPCEGKLRDDRRARYSLEQFQAAFSTKNCNRDRSSTDRHPGQAARCAR